MKVKLLSCVRLQATPWTAAYQGSSVHGIFQARVLTFASTCVDLEMIILSEVRQRKIYDIAYIRRRQWQPTPVLLPGKSHGWRSLVSYSPWGCEESDTTERLHFHFSLSCTGKGNGNSLQYSCMENPRDRSLVGCHLWGRTE